MYLAGFCPLSAVGSREEDRTPPAVQQPRGWFLPPISVLAVGSREEDRTPPTDPALHCTAAAPLISTSPGLSIQKTPTLVFLQTLHFLLSSSATSFFNEVKGVHCDVMDGGGLLTPDGGGIGVLWTSSLTDKTGIFEGKYNADAAQNEMEFNTPGLG